MILDEAEALLDPVSDIDGLMLACLVDARLAQATVEDHRRAKLLVPTGAGRAAIGLIGPGHADAAGRLAAALGEDALAGAVDTLHGLSAALDQIRRASVMTRTSGS